MPTNKNKDLLRYMGLGMQWMVILLLTVLGAWELDKKIGWKIPIFVIILPIVVITLLLWQLIRAFNKPKK